MKHNEPTANRVDHYTRLSETLGVDSPSIKFQQLMTHFLPRRRRHEKESNIAGAHVYFKQPTAKYTLVAVAPPP